MNKEIFPTVDSLVRQSATQIAEWIAETVDKKGTCTLCVAGGSTFAPVYEYLAEMYEDELFWDKVTIIWGDERAVSIMDPDSNVAMVFDTLLHEVDIPSQNIHIIQGARIPSEAATLYEADLRAIMGDEQGFDILLLGVGTDGHTASLFPGSSALDIADKWVTVVDVEGVRHPRITLTLPVLNRFEKVMFVAYGKKKADALQAIFDPETDPRSYPAKLVQPTKGKVYWYLDEKAASKS